MRSSFIRAIFCFTAFIYALNCKANHLVGGDFSYKNLSNGKYEFTLTIYRDCFSSTQLDDSSVITVFNNDNNTYKVYYAPVVSITAVGNQFGPCVKNPPSICLEKGVYKTTITLTSNIKGYKAVFQRCCRNSSIININDPNTYGSTYDIDIPGTLLGAVNNTSPVFVNTPPSFLCANSRLDFDFSANDADGDSLVYSLCASQAGADQADPRPGNAARPPYFSVDYASGFSSANPLGSSSIVTINPRTGLLTAVPKTLGQFVVGICVQEYRNGKLINRTLRDFQFNVASCAFATSYPTVDTSSVDFISQINDSSYIVCSKNTITFTNKSTNVQTYKWDFGVPSVTSDTSSLQNPTFTFPDTGIYRVVLIINPGQSCTDTAAIYIHLNPTVKANFTFLNNVCSGTTIFFKDSSFTQLNDINKWKWTIGTDSIFSKDLSYSFNLFGTYPVKLTVETTRGCVGKITKNAIITPGPNVDFSLKQVCYGIRALFTNQSTIAGGTIIKYYWNLGNGVIDSVNINPTTIYPSNNNYNVQLIAVSDNGCRDTAIKNISIIDSLKPNFTFPASNCQNSPVQFINTSTGNYAGYSWNFRDSLNSTSSATNPAFTYTKGGNYQVKLIVNHAICGKDSIEKGISIKPQPIIALTKNIPICIGSNTQISVPAIYDSLRWNTNETANTITLDGTLNPVSIKVYKNGCTNSDITSLVIKQKPVADFATDKYCANKATAFLNTSTVGGGDSITQNDWNINSGAFISPKRDPVFNLNVIMNYNVQLIVTTNSGCKDTFINTLTLRDTFIPNMIIPGVVCEKSTIQFLDGSIGENIQYTWKFGDGQTASDKDPIHTYNLTGNYIIGLTVQNKNCGNDSISGNIKVNPLPKISLNDSIIMCPDELRSIAAAGDFDSVFWSTGSTTNPATIDGNSTPVIFSGFKAGCKSLDSIKVILNCDIYIPTAFSPNNDGINDLFNFMPINLLSYELRIYDRWGELVFDTNDIAKNWDGTYKGQPCPLDTYVYYATGFKKDKKPFAIKGTLTLLR